MKWWLKLYTIPSMITYSKWLGLALLADFVLKQVVGVMVESIVLYVIPLYILGYSSVKTSFRANLEFHKMSVPFPVLKKAFYTHLVLVFAFLVFGMLIAKFISQLFGGAWSRIPVTSLSHILFLSFLAFVFFVYLNSFTKAGVDKYGFFDSKTSFFRRILLGALASILFFIYFAILVFLNVGSEALMFLMGLPVILSACLFYSRAFFHQTLFRAGKKQYVGYMSAGMASSIGIFLLFAIIGKNDFENKSLSANERMQLFFLWQPLTPEVNKDLFMEFEPQVTDSLQSVELYSNISKKELNEIPVSHFISPSQPWRLNRYVMSGKVNGANLASLLDHMKAQPEWWSKNYRNPERLHTAIVTYWPKREPFPERHLKRSMASAPKEAPAEQEQQVLPTEETQQ